MCCHQFSTQTGRNTAVDKFFAYIGMTTVSILIFIGAATFCFWPFAVFLLLVYINSKLVLLWIVPCTAWFIFVLIKAMNYQDEKAEQKRKEQNANTNNN